MSYLRNSLDPATRLRDDGNNGSTLRLFLPLYPNIQPLGIDAQVKA